MANAEIAAPALMRLRAGIPDDDDVRKAFKSSPLQPMRLAECCIAAKCPLQAGEIRALLALFADDNLCISPRVLSDAVISAPRPLATEVPTPPPTAEEPVDLSAGEVEPPAPPPPEPAAPAAPASELEPKLVPPPAERDFQRKWLAKQTRPAPYATFDADIAPQFPAARVREGEEVGESLPNVTRHLVALRQSTRTGYADGYLGETAAAYALRRSQEAGKGFAGKANDVGTINSARAATLHAPNAKPGAPTPRPRSSAPYAYDFAVGPIPEASDPPLTRVPAGYAPPKAPYDTLTTMQLQVHDAALDKRGRVGPTLWRPPTASAEPEMPAGMLRAYGDASLEPIPRTASWMDAGMSRPASRRGAGDARPKSASQLTFGWG